MILSRMFICELFQNTYFAEKSEIVSSECVSLKSRAYQKSCTLDAVCTLFERNLDAVWTQLGLSMVVALCSAILNMVIIKHYVIFRVTDVLKIQQLFNVENAMLVTKISPCVLYTE